MKNKDSCESWFVWIVKKARFENILYEPQNILKKQEVRPKNLTSIYLGWKKEQYLKQNLIINYELFLRHREETLIMKECLMLIKNLTENKMTI